MNKYVYALILFFCLFADGFAGIRVVSLAPSITDEIIELKGDDMLVGVTEFNAGRLPKAISVGNLRSISIEKIVSLKPDFIFAKEGCYIPESLNRLKEVCENVIVFKREKSFREICENFIKLGKFLGKGEKAEEIVNSLKKQVIKKNFKEYKKAFFIVGFRPIVLAGGKSYINEIMHFAGFENIFKTSKE